jgi:hypothetical protein
MPAGAAGQGKLAAAITVPVGVAALLATGLLLWRRQRHARRAKQSSLPGSSEPPGKHPSQALLLSDVDVERPATRDPMGRSGSGSNLGQHQAIKDQKVSSSLHPCLCQLVLCVCTAGWWHGRHTKHCLQMIERAGPAMLVDCVRP